MTASNTEDIAMTDVILPRTPSDLIELALADLIKCERSSKYVVDMGDWYVPFSDEPCEVCLAGAVIAQRLGDGPNIRTPNDFPKNRVQLFALNELRSGDIESAFDSLGFDGEEGKRFDRWDGFPDYGDNPGKFKREMRKLVRDLRAADY